MHTAGQRVMLVYADSSDEDESEDDRAYESSVAIDLNQVLEADFGSSWANASANRNHGRRSTKKSSAQQPVTLISSKGQTGVPIETEWVDDSEEPRSPDFAAQRASGVEVNVVQVEMIPAAKSSTTEKADEAKKNKDLEVVESPVADAKSQA